MLSSIRFLLAVLFQISSFSIWADWVEFGKNGGTTFYIDPLTIKKDGDLRRVWQLLELAKKAPDGELSRRSLFEYDCKSERHRILDTTRHSGPKAGGKVLGTGGEDLEWRYIAPGTIVARFLKTVCDPKATP